MCLLSRAFARNFKRTPVSIKTEEKKPEEQKTGEGSDDTPKEWMANRHVFIQSMPKALLTGAKTIFSSQKNELIREWGLKIAKNYVDISGVEKPRDISNLQPFANSLNLLEQNVKTPQQRGFYKLPSENSETDMVQIAKLQKEEEKGLSPKFQYQKEHAIGYAYKRMPGTYASSYRILNEIKYRMPEFSPLTCLDYGAGTGASCWAASEVFPDIDCVAVEPSKEMRTVGKKISQQQPKIQWAESLANLPSIAEAKGIFDIVICGYVLTEIENPVTRNLILDALWQRTGKVMIFIEPGTPKGFRLIYSVREWALKTMTREESNIIAPCPHEGVCPLAVDPKSWCHFSQFTSKYPKDVITRVKGEYSFDNEKFSYIAIKRGNIPRYYKASQSLNLAESSFLWPRLVRPTICRHKHVIFDICREGKLERMTLSKGKTEKNVYRFIRKAHWGDLWPFDKAETLKKKSK